MSNLENFIHAEDMHGLPPLVFLALIHYQFEAIHPFPDGNGRVGRLLLPLILCERNVMVQPLLYMSQFFEDNKDEYVDLMLAVSKESAWIRWVDFFLRGVTKSCEATIDKVRRVRELQDDYKQRCQRARSSALLLQIVDRLFETLATTVPDVKSMTGTTYTAAQNNERKLVEYGILKDLNLSRRPKVNFEVELMQIFE
jgi:Fic family protein